MVALLVLGLVLFGLGAPRVDAGGVEVTVPMTVRTGLIGEKTISLAATEYQPGGSGPFPGIVISHGVPGTAEERGRFTAKYVAASTAFVKMGFVVLNPVRRGYGKTGGTYEEDSSNCRFFADAGFETAKDIAAAVSYLRRHPAVDPDRIVLVGQSGGGWGSLAAATRSDVPVKGVVNFAGGRGGMYRGIPNNNCQPDWLVADTGKYGRAARVPSLWIYAENDQYFGPDLSQRMYRAYTEAGGKATLLLVPPFGDDGHNLLGSAKGVPIWRDKVDAFLREIAVLPPR